MTGEKPGGPPPMPSSVLDYKIAVLVFLENTAGEHLLMLRAKPPNLGVWSPIGGKLETALGESPFECAVRETFEETGIAATTSDFHLFAIIAEKAIEYLHGPIVRVTGFDTPFPYTLEDVYMPNPDRVLAGIEKAMAF